MNKNKRKAGEYEAGQKATGVSTKPLLRKKQAKSDVLQYEDWTERVAKWRESKTKYLEPFLHLAEHGYCVIPNLVDGKQVSAWAEEVEQVEALFPKSPGMHGIRQWGPFGHLRVQHQIRSHVDVMDVFAQLWGCPPDQLLTSNDAMCYGYQAKRPKSEGGASPSKSPTKKRTGKGEKKDVKPRAQKDGWLHSDQAFRRRGLWCVQGQMALTDQSTSQGCLVVRRGSHKNWDRFADTAPRFQAAADSDGKLPTKARHDDWNLLTDAELAEFYPIDTYPQVCGCRVPWATCTRGCRCMSRHLLAR